MYSILNSIKNPLSNQADQLQLFKNHSKFDVNNTFPLVRKRANRSSGNFRNA